MQYSVSERVATLTLDRPEKRNVLNRKLILELLEALERAAQDEAVRVLVLTGAGASFSAGADLKGLQELQHTGPMENLEDSRRLARLLQSIYLHEKPVIAKINGHALGGGCGLALACDWAIAADEAKLGFPEVRIGFVPAIVSTFLVRKIGESAARDLLLRGRRIDAKEARRIGLVSQVAAPDKLDDVVAALAGELAHETSASAVALTKRLLGTLPGMALEEALDHAAMVNAFARGTEDCQAGIKAFLEKTDPPWRST